MGIAHKIISSSIRNQACSTSLVINSIEESSKFGNDLGDISILNSYKKDRLSKTIAMTAITDFLFYGFASNSNFAQTILSKGMETLNKSKLKNKKHNIHFLVNNHNEPMDKSNDMTRLLNKIFGKNRFKYVTKYVFN